MQLKWRIKDERILLKSEKIFRGKNSSLNHIQNVNRSFIYHLVHNFCETLTLYFFLLLLSWFCLAGCCCCCFFQYIQKTHIADVFCHHKFNKTTLISSRKPTAWWSIITIWTMTLTQIMWFNRKLITLQLLLEILWNGPKQKQQLKLEQTWR